MLIQVTQHHIDLADGYRLGSYNSDMSHDCPVAQSLKHLGHVTVNAVCATINGVYYRLPLHIRDFILEWDMYEPVEPTQFQLIRYGGVL